MLTNIETRGGRFDAWGGVSCPGFLGGCAFIGEGDEVEFSLHDDGTVTVRGFVSIPTDQAWFFTPDWLAGEKEADNEIAAGRGTVHESADAMFAHLEGLGAADE